MSINIDEAFARLNNSPLCEAMSNEDKMDAWHNGTRNELVGAAHEGKLRDFYNICVRKGYDEEAARILAVARRKGYLQDILEIVDAQAPQEARAAQDQEPALQQLELAVDRAPAEEAPAPEPEEEAPAEEEEEAPATNVDENAAMQRILAKVFDYSTTWVIRESNSDIWFQPLSGNKTRDVKAIRKKVDPKNPNFIYVVKCSDTNNRSVYSLNVYDALTVPNNLKVNIGKVSNNLTIKSAIADALVATNVGNVAFINNTINSIFSWALWDGNAEAWYAPLDNIQKSPEEIAAGQAIVDKNKKKTK